jgi:DNA polymerase-4
MNPAPRKIIHLDLDAFFCAVEEKRDPELRGKAFAVGGRPEARGVVSSCSYQARMYGIRSAMPMSRAVRSCPELIVIPGHHQAYSAESREVMTRLRAVTPLVEQISIDEAFLDVTELPEDGYEIARRLQAQILTELELPCSLGVATNKLIAKIATEVGKASARTGHPPNAIQVVQPGEESKFLAPLPVETLWGVGPKTAARLAELGIHTIGDLASWPARDLESRFGKNGLELARRASGIDDRPIVTTHAAKSVSQETTFVKDIRDQTALLDCLKELSAGVARHLKRERIAGTTIKLKLRWADFTTLTRQSSASQPVQEADEIFALARQLLLATWQPNKAVRLLGVGISNLGPPTRQLSLWEAGEENLRIEKERRLHSVLETLRDRFGTQAVHFGTETDDEN